MHLEIGQDSLLGDEQLRWPFIRHVELVLRCRVAFRALTFGVVVDRRVGVMCEVFINNISRPYFVS